MTFIISCTLWRFVLIIVDLERARTSLLLLPVSLPTSALYQVTLMQAQTIRKLTDTDTIQVAIRIYSVYGAEDRFLWMRTHAGKLLRFMVWTSPVMQGLSAERGRMIFVRARNALPSSGRIQDKNTPYARDSHLEDARREEVKMSETQPH